MTKQETVPMSNAYTEPVSRLLTLGEPDNKVNLDYTAIGITNEHISELIRLSLDEDLLYSDDGHQSFGPIHAWRTLGQLKAVEAIEPLLPLFESESNIAWEEMQDMYKAIGPAALPALFNYISDHSSIIDSTSAIAAIEKIILIHPETIPECTSFFIRQLKNFRENDLSVNGFLITALCELKVLDAAPLIQEAFEEGVVDLDVMGDWEDAQVMLGLLPKRITPRSKSVIQQRFSQVLSTLDLPDSKPKNKDKPKKEESNKKKMAKQSKKKNRKK